MGSHLLGRCRSAHVLFTCAMMMTSFQCCPRLLLTPLLVLIPLKGGMIDTIKEDCPGCPVFGYGNEPSGKYKKDIDAYAGKLDGPCLVRSFAFPTCIADAVTVGLVLFCCLTRRGASLTPASKSTEWPEPAPWQQGIMGSQGSGQSCRECWGQGGRWRTRRRWCSCS